jgi:THO complex subunit 5
MMLEAKIKISMEYPLRPPLFTLNMFGENLEEAADFEWYNELRAMEAEVNVHIVKKIPLDEEEYILSHQIACLAMLFDLYTDEEGLEKKNNSNWVVDVGLCKPVNGSLVARSFRGRDRRKMISSKHNGCTPGYPC